jgi:transposase
MELIGIDVSKSSLVVARKDASSGKYSYSLVANTTEAITSFLAELTPSETRLVMEYSGNFEMRLVELALDRSFKVSIVSGRTIRHFAKMRGVSAKTDKQDAKMIQQYAEMESNKLQDYQFPDEEISILKQRRKLLDDLKKQRRALVNKLEATKLNRKPDELVTSILIEQIDGLDEKIAIIEAHIRQIVQADKILSDVTIPKSVPGIGAALADEFILFGRSFGGIALENIPKMIKLMGLSPANNESGTIKGDRRLVRGGYSSLRSKLYMGALSSVTRKNSKSPFRDYYLRLRAKGKPFKLAIVAVMAKMARVALTLIIKQEKYDCTKHIIAVPQ